MKRVLSLLLMATLFLINISPSFAVENSLDPLSNNRYRRVTVYESEYRVYEKYLSQQEIEDNQRKKKIVNALINAAYLPYGPTGTILTATSDLSYHLTNSSYPGYLRAYRQVEKVYQENRLTGKRTLLDTYWNIRTTVTDNYGNQVFYKKYRFKIS